RPSLGPRRRRHRRRGRRGWRHGPAGDRRGGSRIRQRRRLGRRRRRGRRRSGGRRLGGRGGRGRGRGGRRGRRLGLVALAQLAVLGLVGPELADEARDVGVGVGVAALVLGVGPGAEVAQQGVGLALGREVGHALLRRLGGFAQRLLGLVQEAHVPSFSRARRPWWTAGAYATGRGALRRLSGGGLGR